MRHERRGDAREDVLRVRAATVLAIRRARGGFHEETRRADGGDVGDADGFSSGFECAYAGVGDGDCATMFPDDLVKKDCLVQVQSQAYRISHGEPRCRGEFHADFVRVGTMRDGFVPLVGVDVNLTRVSPVISQKL